ncbi:hypothetical protein U5A82_09005 [Sphingobium sp. CR2-8]|uniref:hypothetical protein n=1 Tax=Sphingobium sp. CR2-8 TaxID=1306534 RepID=UPI002DBAD0CD|nr:hypothetical protein [Sphingobium sp. CR2-8]MEC3910612.1 hypothetical protein [Sphingobium sp. CR2-8]
MRAQPPTPPSLAETPIAKTPPGRPTLLARPVPGGWLIAAIAAWLGVGQLLLWRFLDIAPLWAYGLGAILIAGLCAAIARTARSYTGPTVATLLLCIGLAGAILMLGGEGRFFYANIDWQVRFAALRDMSAYPWPFVYMRAEPEVLRAPVGMFLAPALIGKIAGARAADLALLVQNSLMLGAILALLTTLFETRRAKAVALFVFMVFSGLDVLGRLLIHGGLSDHLENWSGLQYSSTVTLAFWVPNHAISGWIGALSFLLWRAGKIPLGAALALLPLTALWSPLGLIGAMPFALLAGVRTLYQRSLRVPDIALPALASLIAVPGLLYLAAAGNNVGMRAQTIVPLQWGIFELLEILVYIAPLALMARSVRFGRDTLALVTVWLLVIPFVQIGSSIDMMMRGSICALTILAIMVADALLGEPATRRLLIGLLAIGSITGLAEIRRALVHPPAPEVRCSIFKAWRQNFGDFPIDSYVAPLSAMPALVRPTAPAQVRPAEPPRCWDGSWYHPEDPSVR